MSEKETNYEEIIDQLAENLDEKRNKWNKIITSLAARIKDEIQKSIQLESEAISYRQLITEEIAKYTYRIYRDVPKFKQLNKSMFEFYMTRYQFKTNSTEKGKLIDADLAWQKAKLQIYENYIEFLGESRKSVDHIIWSVKNKINIHNITGLE
jgi:hypothetical protein